MSRASFVDACLAGDALPEDIADYVDAWHEGESKVPLHTFLGFAREDYALYVERPRYLRIILAAYREGIPVAKLVASENEVRLAARSTDAVSASEVRKWLRKKGHLVK